MIEYTVDHDIDIDSLKLAFSKNENSSDNRKKWLASYDKHSTLDYTNPMLVLLILLMKTLNIFQIQII